MQNVLRTYKTNVDEKKNVSAAPEEGEGGTDPFPCKFTSSIGLYRNMQFFLSFGLGPPPAKPDENSWIRACIYVIVVVEKRYHCVLLSSQSKARISLGCEQFATISRLI